MLCGCVFLSIWTINKTFINETNSDNFLKDFLKSNESKIDKVRRKNVNDWLKPSCGLNYCAVYWYCILLTNLTCYLPRH